MAQVIAFTAHGRPETKGSSRAFVIGGRARIINDNPRAKAWAAVVSLRAREAMRGRPPIEGPVNVSLDFYVARPQGHYRTGRNGGTVKASAPRWPAVLPDLDKLARCAIDALSKIVFVDDGAVVCLVARKLYAGGGIQPGVAVMVQAMPELLTPPVWPGYREDSTPPTVY